MPDRQIQEEQAREVEEQRERADSERWELLHHVQAILEPLMIVLGFVFLVLLFVDYASLLTDRDQIAWLSTAMTVIWVIFLIDFLLRLVVAPQKWPFLKSNWLTAVSLALPFLRPLRAFRALRVLRAARATRSLSLVRLVGGVNRGLRILQRTVGGQQIAYVAATTILVILAGAVGIWYFDRGVEGSQIDSFGVALWWSAAQMTTIGSEIFPVSGEAKVVSILVSIYALSVFGFVTATIATYFIGRQAEEQIHDPDEETARATARLEAQLAALHEELALLRSQLAAQQARLPSSEHVAADSDDRMVAKETHRSQVSE